MIDAAVRRARADRSRSFLLSLIVVSAPLALDAAAASQEARAPRQEPPPAPAPAAVPPPAAPQPPTAATQAPAQLTRLADPVAYLDGEARDEDPLFFWDDRRALRIGDGVRQGVAGIFELYFEADGTVLRFFGGTQAFLTDATAHRELRLDEADRVFARVRAVETTFRLPGGTVLIASGTTFRVQRDDMLRRFVIRNAGPGKVAISGPVVPLDVSTLESGTSVEIPAPLPGAAGPAGMPSAAFPPDLPAERRDVWRGRTIHLGPGIESTKMDDALILGGEGDAWIGGARLRLRGRQVTIRTPGAESIGT